MIVREAMLDDTQDIVAIHLTNPDRPFDRPVESLSIAERNGHGGPWMSVESCAIHLNNLLAWGYAPLVVEDQDRVIAETEFYIGRDIAPLGTTLDISVLYVHADFQRQGAGSLLMEEMIARARNAGCDHITVSGDLGSPGFYGRFGFSHVLDLQVVNCDVPSTTGSWACKPYVPGDFQTPPEGTLWIGRCLSPTQKWREIVDAIKKRDVVLPEHIGRPEPVGMVSRPDAVLAYLVPAWGNPLKSEVYCWSETLTRRTVSELLAQAHLAGYDQACLLCHPKVVETVAEVCGVSPSGSRPIWTKEL